MTLEEKMKRLADAMRGVQSTVEFYMKREIESPSNHKEFAREAQEKLDNFRATIALLDAPAPARIYPCGGIAPQDKEPCALPQNHTGPHSHIGPFRNNREPILASLDAPVRDSGEVGTPAEPLNAKELSEHILALDIEATPNRKFMAQIEELITARDAQLLAAHKASIERVRELAARLKKKDTRDALVAEEFLAALEEKE